MKLPRFATAIMAIPAMVTAEPPPDGAQLYTMNCAACHVLDQAIVGPSLVEIRSLYLNKPDDFVKWAIAPGKKRPGAVDMPSMIHVGEPGLRAIHAYILDAAKGVKEKKIAKGDPYAASPTQAARPQIQRIFMPEASPAAIAIALNDKVSLCWDAGNCRLRYAWVGNFINGYSYWRGNGSSFASINGEIRYRENAPLFPGTTKFKGYEIKNGLPVLYYTAGSIEVAESFEALPNGEGFKRHIRASAQPATPPAAAKIKITPQSAAQDFTFTYTFE